jgi:hypothetical protein
MANFDEEMFRIKPVRIFSWGLESGVPGAGRDVPASSPPT